MSRPAAILVLAALAGAAWSHDVSAVRKTVCAITVNSPDEQAMFRRSLPPDRFGFVELVEHGRPDWLASACRRQIRCDVLVISGHFDGVNEFFSDRTEASEYLPVDEMERVSCSESCPGLFSQLKEVYLFGCNTLNPGALTSAGGEIERSLVRAGHSPAEAERLARALGARHGESSRDRMRQIFADVPVIYGFSSVAPLGPAAGAILQRYFQAGGTSEVGSGRPSPRLLGHFAGHGMVVAAGLTAADPQASYRRDICQFADDRLSVADKLRYIHRLLDRDMAEVRLFLDHIDGYVTALPPQARQAPAAARALDEIAQDRAARARYLEFARDTDGHAVRARMLRLAHDLGWLSPAELRAELMQMIDQLLAADSVSAADVDLVCSLNETHDLDRERQRLQLSSAQADKAGHAAVLACLGSPEGHARILRALTSTRDGDVQIAQAYLYRQPITDVTELRAVARAIADMRSPSAQIRAIDTLARLHLSDPQSLEELIRLFEVTASADVQTAVAGVLIRADYSAFATPELVQTLRERRLKSSPEDDPIDVLIRRLPGS